MKKFDFKEGISTVNPPSPFEHIKETKEDLTDEEYDTISEEVHANMVCSLIEAGAEINELKADNKTLLKMLKEVTHGLYVSLITYDGALYDEISDAAYRAQRMINEMELKNCETLDR